jgi:hypothetical protein
MTSVPEGNEIGELYRWSKQNCRVETFDSQRLICSGELIEPVLWLTIES